MGVNESTSRINQPLTLAACAGMAAALGDFKDCRGTLPGKYKNSAIFYLCRVFV
jgi:hypothetical protein